MTETAFVCKKCGSGLRIDVNVVCTGYFHIDPKTGVSRENLYLYQDTAMEYNNPQPVVMCITCRCIGNETGWEVKTNENDEHFLIEALSIGIDPND